MGLEIHREESLKDTKRGGLQRYIERRASGIHREEGFRDT